MHSIALDASRWRNPEHFYRALLPELGAPAWHGHNLDAIDDSIFTGGINRVDPPLHIQISGTNLLSDDMKAFLRKVEGIFVEGRSAAEVTISFEPPLE